MCHESRRLGERETGDKFESLAATTPVEGETPAAGIGKGDECSANIFFSNDARTSSTIDLPMSLRFVVTAVGVGTDGDPRIEKLNLSFAGSLVND